MGLTGQALADYAAGKKGTPYFYGSKMAKLTESFMLQMHNSYPNTVTENYMQKARGKGQVGKVCTDCSGLVSAYTGKVLGSAQLYQQAYTRLKMSTYRSWADGVVVWRSGHVGVFFEENGSFYVAESKGIDSGTVVSTFDPGKWSYGLTFSWLEYYYEENVAADATWREVNPYKMPNETIKLGSNGEGVKWTQWELREAGYDLKIDGDCGSKTDKAIRAFQASCKIKVDGKVGPDTRSCLIGNMSSTTASAPVGVVPVGTVQTSTSTPTPVGNGPVGVVTAPKPVGTVETKTTSEPESTPSSTPVGVVGTVKTSAQTTTPVGIIERRKC